MELEKPMKEGYLLFPPHGVLSQLKKSWHKKYCQLFKSSKHGIERLEIFDSEDDVMKNVSARIITLENCIKITPDTQKQQNMFVIVTKTGSHHFATQSENEMTDWIIALQSVAFKDDTSRHTIEEDNDLYCSSGEGVFSVTLVPSEASIRCGLDRGSYTLVVASAAIQLRDSSNDHLLFTWPYRYIRRYGYRDGKFTFEAGRKCDTGEGMFHLEHSNQQEIFRCISSKMKHMRKLLRGETSPTPAIICGDNQFQAALSMEARSRSPLPPSPTSATPLTDHDFSTISQSSTKPLITPLSEIKPFITPIIKPKPRPMKPPRKHIFSSTPKLNQENIDMSSDMSSNSIVLGSYRRLPSNDPTETTTTTISSTSVASEYQDYDKVEVRKDAWRTMGVDDMTHTETVSAESKLEDEITNTFTNKMANLKTVSEDTKVAQGSKILLTQISNKSDGIEDYDTLQHFGSSSKLNYPGYQHIPAAVSNAPVPTTHTSPTAPQVPPRQDQVVTRPEGNNENMQAFRLADDSHQGYGMIRKKSTSNIQADLGPSHAVYNQQEYAIVLKPKRV